MAGAEALVHLPTAPWSVCTLERREDGVNVLVPTSGGGDAVELPADAELLRANELGADGAEDMTQL